MTIEPIPVEIPIADVDLREFVHDLDLPKLTDEERHELFGGEWHEGPKSDCELCRDA